MKVERWALAGFRKVHISQHVQLVEHPFWTAVRENKGCLMGCFNSPVINLSIEKHHTDKWDC